MTAVRNALIAATLGVRTEAIDSIEEANLLCQKSTLNQVYRIASKYVTLKAKNITLQGKPSKLHLLCLLAETFLVVKHVSVDES